MGYEAENGMTQVTYTIESAKKEKAYTLAFEYNGRKKYVLSKYTPIKESKELIGTDFGNKDTIWIFFGFAFGYMIEEIFRKCGEETQIIVIEPNEQLLLDQIRQVQKEDWLNKENIKIYTGNEKEDITRLFQANIPSKEVGNFKVITRSGYLEFYSKYYANVARILDDVTNDIIIQSNTLKRFGGIFLKNVIRNRYAIQESYDLSYHKDRYKSIPALIVSGGPSLSKNIEFIKQFNGLVFTGGRTLTPILQQGMKPDFLVSVDAQDITYDTLRENASNDLPLITLDQGNDKVVAANKGPQYFLLGEEFTKEFLGIKKYERLSMGGSVATICISAAQYMGCNPIIFIGQDLAYTDMKFHADECSDAHIYGNENTIKEQKDYTDLGYKQVESVTGGMVWTTSVLISYLNWIEKFIELCPENEFINATEGGAKIRGAINKTFEEVVEQYSTVYKPEIKHIKMNETIDIDKNIVESVRELEVLKSILAEAEKISNQLVNEYKIYKGSREDKIVHILDKLELKDKQIRECSDKKDIVNYLFTTVYTELERNKKYKQTINDTQLCRDRRIAEYNRELYKKLSQIISDVIELINKEMNKNE